MKVETERLRICRINEDDSQFIFTLLNTSTWIKNIGDRGISSVAKAAKYIDEYYLPAYKNYGYGSFKIVLKNSNTTIGLVGYYQRDYLDSADIGYALLPEFEGIGYAFEATSALLKYGKNVFKMHPIYAITSSNNSKSQALLDKLNFKFKKEISVKKEKEKIFLYTYEQ